MIAALLINFLFWTGVAIGGIVLAALVDVCGGRWLGPIRAMAERLRWFLPVSFGCFVLLMWQQANVYPWARQPAAGWLAPVFVTGRDAVTLIVVYAVAFAYCERSRRLRASPETAAPIGRVAVLFLVVYAAGFSIITIDLVMSLEPEWTSTLFPAYVFTGNVYAGTAALAMLASWRGDAADPHAASRMRDLANLIVGVALFWTYLFWSQFLVIWYGNLTAEVGFLTARIGTANRLGWIVLAACCVVPSVALVPQRGKRASALRVVSVVVLVGMWLERWLLVAVDLPAASRASTVAITVVFAAVFAITSVDIGGMRHAERSR